MNGVINIITRSAKETHGSYYQAGGGTEQRAFAGARVGGQTESGVNYRVWGKWFERGSLYSPTQLNFDDWRQGRVGFRADWESDLSDSYTVQGDLYTGSNGIANDQPVVGLEVGDEPVAGGYVLSRWTRDLEENGQLQLQMYYNKWNRDTLGFKQNHDTFDIDMQHQFGLDDRNEIVWGLAFRQIWDRLPNDQPLPLISYDPDQRTYTFFSAFIQDSYELSEDELYLMAGAKLLDNTFTRFEVQPGARLLYLPNQRTAMWAAISRAIRTPSRTSQDGNVVVGDIGGAFPVRVLGSHDLDSEETLVYEMGIRQQPSDDFSWDLSLFYNVDQRLISFRPTTTPGTLQFFNGAKSDSYGCELTGQLELTDDWRFTSWYAFLRTVGTSDPRAIVPSADLEEGTPRHQAFMMSSWDIGKRSQLDLLARYVDNNPSLNVPSFISMDLRAAWQATDALELTLVGQNLLDSHRPEYGSSLFVHEVATEVRRGVYGMATVRY